MSIVAAMNIQLTPARRTQVRRPTRILTASINAGFGPDISSGRKTIKDVLGVMLNPPRPRLWGPYWALMPDEEMFGGMCAFKAAPQDGEVEIAYLTFPNLEGRGIARMMCDGLIQIAKSEGLRAVTASTLPEANASVSVLKRSGFEFFAVEQDPEDGEVWRWRLRLA